MGGAIATEANGTGHDHTALHARVLGFVFLGGGLSGLLSLPFAVPGFRAGILASLIAVAFPIAASCLLLGARLPMALVHLYFSYATFTIGCANVLGGTQTAPYVPYFAWIVAYAGYFFRGRALVVHLALVSVSIGVAVVVGMPPGERLQRALPEISTLLVLAWLVQRLRSRHDATVIELERVARTDGLTGLRNRRAFSETLPYELALSVRQGQPFSLILCDLDRFKRVNDTWGHPIGDECLVQIARALAGRLRSNDALFRVGGEELAVVLPDTDAAGAQRVAEELRGVVAALALPSGIQMTMSLGIAQAPLHAVDLARLYEVADAALYRAKEQGRDCSVVGPASESAPVVEDVPAKRSGS